MSRSSTSLPGSASEYTLRSLGSWEFLFFIQTVQVGIGLFNLPRVVSEEAGRNGWMGIALAGLSAQFLLLVMVLLLRRFENLDIYAILCIVFGKWAGHALGMFFALYSAMVAGVVARTYIEVVQSWLFPTTSKNVFFLLFLLPLLYCATGGARVLGRFASITFFATTWMLILLTAPIRQIQYDYYFPLWDTTIPAVLRATWKSGAAMIGFELLLVIYPFVQQKKKTLRLSSIAVWITTGIYLFVTLVAIGFYSQGQIISLLSPTLHMFQIVELPLIERVEHIGIAFWSFLIINTAASYIWAAGRYLYTWGKFKENTCIYLFTPILVVMGIFPQDVYMLTKFESLIATVGGILTSVLPAATLLIAILRGKKGGSA